MARAALALALFAQWLMRCAAVRLKSNASNLDEALEVQNETGAPNYIRCASSCLNSLPFAERVRPPRNKDVEALNVFIYADGNRGPGYKRANATAEHVKLCHSMFPKEKPFSAGGKPVCMLAETESRGLQPVFWSDYNPTRGLPNFVAWKDIGETRIDRSEREWRTVASFDKRYKPGPVTTTSDSQCSSSPDDACSERVGSRGHMATMSTFAWDDFAAGATCTYLNTLPSRQPFDGAQWNDRERRVQDYAKDYNSVFVLGGPSVERDGQIHEGLDVPSMYWNAVYDPQLDEAVAWTCRNGLDRDTPCACADGLTIGQIGDAVGISLWPDIEPGLLRDL